jgi:beta-glucosidase
MEEQKISTSKKQPTRIAAIALIAAGFLAGGPTLAQALYPYQDANLSVEDRVNDLLPRMDINEKVGQMTQCSSDASPATVATYFMGSVLCGGHQGPGGDNGATAWANLYDSYQNAALSTRLGIPIIYGIDAVHGHNKVRNAVVFPHNIGLGAANDPNLIERIGAVTANEVAATGIDWTFGPSVAVARDERWGRTYESFAEDPQIHNNIVAAYVWGFQGVDANMPGEKIVACAKHYIGDGGTTGGIDRGVTECNEAILRAIHLPGYQRAIEANVGTVMPYYSTWNGKKCVFNRWLITDLLKNELGFKGFVISDWEDITGTDSADVNSGINAGVDMAMVPSTWSSFITTLRTLVNNGQVPQSRIDDAVRRILRIKFRAGLFEHPLTDRTLLASFGSAEHKAVAREAVRKSLVLLKNENDVLPIAKDADVFVAGPNATSLKNQCGGWTIGWQGMGSDSDTNGTTILKGIQNTCTGGVTYSANGSGAAGYDVAIVVVGEGPYAEGSGDRTDLHLSSTDVNTINRVRDSGTPYVIVLISGRPMIVTSQIADADAFVAAWLPGTEGQGVADVLFGDYGFTGKLSFSWPRDMNQIPINVGDANYNPLFPFGYGIVSGADFDRDGDVDVADLEVFCGSWLKVPGDPGYDSRANLYESPLNIVNFYDFAVFANEWKPSPD